MGGGKERKGNGKARVPSTLYLSLQEDGGGGGGKREHTRRKENLNERGRGWKSLIGTNVKCRPHFPPPVTMVGGIRGRGGDEMGKEWKKGPGYKMSPQPS